MPTSSIIHFSGSLDVFSGPPNYSGFLPLSTSEKELRPLRSLSTPEKLLDKLSRGKPKPARPFLVNHFVLSSADKTKHLFDAFFSLYLKNGNSFENVMGFSSQDFAAPESGYRSYEKELLWRAHTPLSAPRIDVRTNASPTEIILPFQGDIKKSVSSARGHEITYAGEIRCGREGRSANLTGTYVNARYNREVKKSPLNFNQGAFSGQIRVLDKRTSTFGMHVFDATTRARFEFTGDILRDEKIFSKMKPLARAAESTNLTNRVLSYVLGAQFLSKFGPATKLGKLVTPALVLGVVYVAWQNYKQAHERDGARNGLRAKLAASDGTVDVLRAAAETKNYDPTGTIGNVLDWVASKAKSGLRKEITSYKNGTYA